jgi:hypothetical protein
MADARLAPFRPRGGRPAPGPAAGGDAAGGGSRGVPPALGAHEPRGPGAAPGGGVPARDLGEPPRPGSPGVSRREHPSRVASYRASPARGTRPRRAGRGRGARRLRSGDGTGAPLAARRALRGGDRARPDPARPRAVLLPGEPLPARAPGPDRRGPGAGGSGPGARSVRRGRAVRPAARGARRARGRRRGAGGVGDRGRAVGGPPQPSRRGPRRRRRRRGGSGGARKGRAGRTRSAAHGRRPGGGRAGREPGGRRRRPSSTSPAIRPPSGATSRRSPPGAIVPTPCTSSTSSRTPFTWRRRSASGPPDRLCDGSRTVPFARRGGSRPGYRRAPCAARCWVWPWPSASAAS